ncbi:MAG: hypothetical protein IAF38_22515 [Bacteroidia bacterium]|nr:hypothetical protein [Bacteroidia bacterium]
MKKIEPLYIEKDKDDFGLRVDCAECGTLPGAICRKSCMPIMACEFGHRHSFKVIAYEKHSGRRRTKNLKTRDWKQARLEAAQFQKEVKESISPKVQVEKPIVNILEKQNHSLLLTEGMALHVSYLRGEQNIPDHQRRARSEGHCRPVEKCYLDFISCLKKDYPVKNLTVNQVDQNMVGRFHSLLESRNPAPRTYNININYMQTLFNFLKREGHATLNPFAGVIRKPETPKITVLNKEEYEAMLEIVQKPELGICKLSSGISKNYFRPWIKDFISAGIFSGRRIEELAKAQWKSINFDREEMQSLEVIDYKVSRQQARLETNPKRILVPITSELKNLLFSLGAERYKNDPDRYILAGDEEMSRDSIKKFVSHSFSHYWKQLPYSKDKQASYKTLRKTYLSSLAGAIGISNAQVISQHSDTKVLSDHYVSSLVLGETAKNFSVFPNKDQNKGRQKKLNELRKSEKNLSIER